MKIYALMSWYDESPDHLTACVESLAGFADHIVAVDGRYAMFEGPDASDVKQVLAIGWAAKDARIISTVITPNVPWQGGEVEKRAAMFEYGRVAGATPEDWFLIIDADMTVARCEGAREALEATEDDTAEVLWQDIGAGGGTESSHRFRSLFRAIPGLTVERTHWLYVAHTDPNCHHGKVQTFGCCGRCVGLGDCCCAPEAVEVPCSTTDCLRYLWHTPDGNVSREPSADLLQHLTLHHKRALRDPERNHRAGQYYQARDAARLEVAE